MKKFMLGCRVSFEAYAKSVREKVTKCSLKTAEVLLDIGCILMDMCLPKFNICQSTVAPESQSIITLDVVIFFRKKHLSDVRSEIHLHLQIQFYNLFYVSVHIGPF